MFSIVNLYTLFSQTGPLAHAFQQRCPPKSPEQSDPEHTVLLLVPSRTTSTSESSAQQRSREHKTAPLKLAAGGACIPHRKITLIVSMDTAGGQAAW